ncbi:glycosyltransferase [archaeon]|nr:glycosyltransferase [archaeon]
MKGEIIVVDDNSPDGTGKILDKLSLKQKNIKIIHRTGKLGLSSAVLEGWKISRGKVLGVMDADLSHPPEKIKELFWPIKKG